MSEFVDNALAALRSKLLDLTRRNRLLNFKESAKSIRVVDELPDEVFRILVADEKDMQFLPLISAGADIDDTSEELQETIANVGDKQVRLPLNEPLDGRKRTVKLSQNSLQNELPSSDDKTAERHLDTKLQTPFSDTVLERRCKKLLQESRTAIEETGSNLLHLAIGFLEWYEADDSAEMTRAPLILVPVKIERSKLDSETNCYNYVISHTGEDIETNLSLAEKLNRDFGLVLPTLDSDVTPEEYFASVAKITGKRPRWRVAREMVLGLFSFSKLLMYRDLDPSRWPSEATIIDNLNVCQVLGGCCENEPEDNSLYGEEYNIDEDSSAEALPLVLDADSSQSSVIVDAIRKRMNLVVEGPPGTGKSQTITNLIAAALHDGLSVLFVAEKKAALEVVRSRLNHVGLGDFCLELHSHKTQKGQLHIDIGRRIRKVYRDNLTLERECADLAQERHRLIAYTHLVNSKEGLTGETIYEIFWAAERFRAALAAVPLNFRVNKPLIITSAGLNRQVNLLTDIARLRHDLPDEAIKAWNDFTPGALLPGDEANVLGMLNTISSAIDVFNTVLGKLVAGVDWPIPFNVTQLRKLLKTVPSVLDEMPSDFLQQQARALIEDKNSVAINVLSDAITKHRILLKAAKLISENMGSQATMSDVQQIADYAQGIVSLNFSNLTLAELVELAGQIAQAIDLLKQLEDVAADTSMFLSFKPKTLAACQRITDLKHLLDTVPAEVMSHTRGEYALESTKDVVANARSACNTLVKQLEVHARTFTIRYLPGESELADLARGLRGYRGSFMAVFSPNYWSLRRRLKGILVDIKQVGASDIIERIESLIDTLEAINAAKINETFCRTLGPLYNGIKTKWETLEECVAWGQNLTDVVCSSSKAQTLISNIADYINPVTQSAMTVERVAGDLKPLTVAIGINLNDVNSSISSILEGLSHKHEYLSQRLKPLLEVPNLSTYPSVAIVSAAKSFISAEKKAAQLDSQKYQRILGDVYRGTDTDIERVQISMNWLELLQSRSELPHELIVWLTDVDTRSRCEILKEVLLANRILWDACTKFTGGLTRYGEISKSSLFRTAASKSSLADMALVIDAYRQNIQHLVTWCDFRKLIDEAKEHGLEEFTDAIDDGRIAPDECAAIYRHAVYDSMARELVSKHRELSTFTRSGYEGTRDRFATLDRQILSKTCERIAFKTSTRHVPRGVSHGPVRDHTDLSLIDREIQKQKRHIPIRQLVLRAGAALRALKPCFMMSPLSVAQYLGTHHQPFDIVIMDEASQLKPEDALGAIARAKQVVVVGDSHQLPPSSFFDRTDVGSAEDDEDIAAVQESESILDACHTTFNKRRLRWHYRSEHESLIAFSNNRFYDDDLIIFPSPMGKNQDYGVHRHYVVDATYLKGRNRAEAEAVVTAVAEHFRTNPERSLGVATFNREQAELVLDILERQQKAQPWLELAIRETEGSEEPFFVKNLENVQGDERDVIFVSTTYGPDQNTGKVYQRFGPIAGDTGWRRLNVIFTRAKKRLVLFTSMLASDIKLSENPSRGVLALKEYLAYAETGFLPDYGDVDASRAPDSDFEVAVAKHLNDKGYHTRAQIGVAGFFIDIGVLAPEGENEFILGIECDGATYHSAKSVRDRDRLRQEILEKKGWRIHRIWSTDWFKNRDREMQRLLDAVKKAMSAYSPAIQRPVIQEIIDVTAVSKETRTGPPKSVAPNAPPRNVAKELREELVEYRQTNILPAYPDITRSILRDEMIERLVFTKPISKEEFYGVVPIELRQHTDGSQMQYLQDILEIIDAYV